MILNDSFGLMPIWDASFDIYKEFVKICDKHSLRYYATDGTALGAVRHKSYIPWDDDFDVSMPRPDYEKFLRIAEAELPKHLKLITWKNTPEYHLLFGKIQNVQRDYVENIEKRVGHVLSNGVFIDVFPIEGYPTSAFAKIKINVLSFVYRQILWFRVDRKCRAKVGNRGLLTRWAKTITGCIFACLFIRLKNWQDVLGAYEDICREFSFDQCDYTGRTCSSLTVLRRQPLKKSAWGSAKEMEFHTGMIKVPEDYDAHLRNEYYKWDYMVLPPEEQRHPSHGYPYRCAWWLGPTTSAAPF